MFIDTVIDENIILTNTALNLESNLPYRSTGSLINLINDLKERQNNRLSYLPVIWLVNDFEETDGKATDYFNLLYTNVKLYFIYPNSNRVLNHEKRKTTNFEPNIEPYVNSFKKMFYFNKYFAGDVLSFESEIKTTYRANFAQYMLNSDAVFQNTDAIQLTFKTLEVNTLENCI